MQVTCPQCSNVFTTELSGRQFCPRCGKQLEVPEVAASPAGAGPGLPPGSPPPSEGVPTPWERRSEPSVGPVTGLFETARRACLTPGEFFPSLRPRVPMWEALSFAWVIGAISSVLSVPVSVASNRAMRPLINQLLERLPPETKVQLGPWLAMSGGIGSAVANLVVQVLFWPVVIIVFAAVIHLLAMVLSADKNGYEATLRAVAYGSAPLLLYWIPIVNFAAILYAMVLMAWGVMSLHKTTRAKAGLAVFLLPALGCCCCCCGIGAMGFMGGSLASMAQ